jgi:cytochrome c
MPLISKLSLALAPWRMAQACAIAVGMSFSALVLANGSNSGGPPTGAPPAMTLEEGLALAKARACLGCHQVDNKRVGPSFRAIAQRRANQEDAVSYLVQVIRKGGRGQWGAVPMPGQSVSEQDAEKLAQWIISLGK